MNSGNRKRKNLKAGLILAVLVLLPVSRIVLAETKSDYDRSFDFASLKTWDFKVQTRMPTDPVGTNTLWNQRIRTAIEQQLAETGFERLTNREPSFLVAYYMGTKEKYDTRYINYGFPIGWGWHRWWRWGGWWGWGPWGGDFDVWNIPYTESTLVLDIIDPQSNLLIWRGYDTETVDFNKSEKAINKAVDNLVNRFVKNIEESNRKPS
jgi:hypothetical protein